MSATFFIQCLQTFFLFAPRFLTFLIFISTLITSLVVGADDRRAWSAAGGVVHARRRARGVCQRRGRLSAATQSLLSLDVL